jgi:hypothetical protein
MLLYKSFKNISIWGQKRKECRMPQNVCSARHVPRSLNVTALLLLPVPSLGGLKIDGLTATWSFHVTATLAVSADSRVCEHATHFTFKTIDLIGLAIKNPPNKTQKNPPKKPHLKAVFWGFFKTDICFWCKSHYFSFKMSL